MAEQDVISKLRLEKYPRKLVLNLPGQVTELASLSFEQATSLDTIPVLADGRQLPQPLYDLILAFVFSLGEMAAVIRQVSEKQLLDSDGALIMVYPKKGNKVYPQYIGRDDIFPFIHVSMDTGLVEGTSLKFNAMSAFNETFTATSLKQLGAKSIQAAQASRQSQSASQFVDQIPALEQWLEARPDVLAFFQSLTPGYQKDWARFVYSAKTAATVEKRLSEMAEILAQGYKSINLYRQDRE